MHTNHIREKIFAGVRHLREMAHLVPEILRDSWIKYLDGHIDHYISVISRLPPPECCGRILEIGCVPGQLTFLIKSLGYDIDCVDINPARLSEFWKALPVEPRKVDVETEPLPFEDKSFSVILFTEILEHLRVQPIFALRETARVIEDNGQLILSVPNITFRKRWKFLFGHDYQGDIIKAFEQLEKVGHMGHFRLYSASEIQRMLKHVGYADIQFASEGRIKGSKLWQILFFWSSSLRGILYFVASPKIEA